MGGPKADLQIRERPILEHLLERFAWAGPRWLVTAPGREHPPGCERFDRELIDPARGLGPLRGVFTALEHLQTPALVVATVDMPAIQRLHLSWIASQLQARPDKLGFMYQRAEGSIEPVPLALRGEARPIIQARLKAGKGSVRALLEEPGFASVPAPQEWGPSTWTNLNEPHDLRRFMGANDPM